MPVLRRFAAAASLLLISTTGLLSQWQNLANPAIEQNYSVGAACGRMIIQQAYAARPPFVSSDGGSSWKAYWSTGGWPRPWSQGLWPYCGGEIGTDTVIFGLASSFLNKTTNFGEDWTRADTGLNRTDLSSIAFSHGSGDLPQGILVAGSWSAGVFRSTDLGGHWTSADSGLPALAVTSLAATESTLFVGVASKGLFRSTDNGTTWNPMGTDLVDPAAVVAGTVGRSVYAFAGKTLYASADDGSSWTAADTNSLPGSIISVSLVATPGTGAGAALFAFTGSGIYRMLASEPSWKKLSPPTFTATLGARSLAAAGGSLCYVEPNRIYRSTDLGDSWEWVAQNMGGAVWIARPPSGDNGSALYTMNQTSLSVSTDQGHSWRGLLTRDVYGSNGEGPLQCLSIGGEGTPGGPLRYTVGTTGSSALMRSVDGGKSWHPLWNAYNTTCTQVLDLDTVLYAAVGSLQRSTDGGTTWTPTTWGAASDSGIVSLTALRMQSGKRVVFSGNWDHLYRSGDDGATWTECQFAARGTGRRWFGLVGKAIYLANGGTRTISYDDSGNPTTHDDSSGVFRSTDDGVTWEDISGDMHAGIIRGLGAVVPSTNPLEVFLAVVTDEAVITSTVGGKYWARLSINDTTDLPGVKPNLSVASLTADADYIYLRGTWRRSWADVPTTTVEVTQESRIPAAYSLAQNFPNPFNPSTTIRYGLPQRSQVVLTVYNTLGQRVAELLNGEVGAGIHEVRFNARNLASGVYFCRLQAGGHILTQRMALVK